MLETKEISDLRSVIDAWKKEGLRVSFVPTMGALHQGHLSLIQNAAILSDRVVCSIFVNPTQFNDQNDFLKYPRTVEEDLKLLATAPCDMVFTPSADVIYPAGASSIEVDYGKLTQVLEAAHRPGHFDGVVGVVGRLFDLVQPDIAVFGEKDFQQLAIIREMCVQQHRAIEVVAAPIIREDSGLAMSSRNQRLSEQSLKTASAIFYTLRLCKILSNYYPPKEVLSIGINQLKAEENFELEYFSIVDERDWAQPESLEIDRKYRILCAVWCDGVRLIDNIEL